MSVIVQNDRPVEEALRLLWRESMREGVIETVKERRYYIKPTSVGHAKRRTWAKTKKRRARANRKFRNKK